MPKGKKGGGVAAHKQAAGEGGGSAFFTYCFLFPVLAGVALDGCGIFPVSKVFRNCAFPAKPGTIKAKYPTCSDEMLAKEMTIVVSVKDACSQAPGFIKGLEKIAPRSVHLIYSFPNFTSCATIDMQEQLDRWDKVTLLPLTLRSSPMQGWIDAVEHVTTPYSLLLHNDGYALDDFFACELLSGLKARKKEGYVASAPMLYESKADGSLAAHATQDNLRLVKNSRTGVVTVRHDHSVARALNRGLDFEEGEQSEFIEDHGFMIETDKVTTVVDPKASFTLEYLDMIMTLRSNMWKVLFVPTARLEFRITEFSWRDIPYFMYKRSEITAHGCRDYLSAKWKAAFPNTGFWTFIKYTIVEQHRYVSELADMAWKDQAALVFGFFQMSGYNRYGFEPNAKTDFVDVLVKLDGGWAPEGDVSASRTVVRPEQTQLKETKVDHLGEILPIHENKFMPHIEADLPLEYLPFAGAKLQLDSCAQVRESAGLQKICGLVINETSSDGASSTCTCWINMPTFKSNSFLIKFLNEFAGWVKIPSRVTTYLEMFLHSTRQGTEHVAALRKFERAGKFELATCNVHQTDCERTFSFGKGAQLEQFQGRPPSANEVAAVLEPLMAAAV